MARMLPSDRPLPDSPVFLVVDDDLNSRFLNRSILEMEFPQSTVIESGSVAEALAACGRIRVDAVLTDHHLGESDGADFITRMRQQGTDCPVVMVTGSSDPKVHQRAYQAGAAHVFFGNDLDFAGYLRTAIRKQ